MAPAKTTDPKDLITGGVLQCAEAITFGMPFEVWKTHMGTYRKETTMESFRKIYQKNGVASFWAGWQVRYFFTNCSSTAMKSSHHCQIFYTAENGRVFFEGWNFAVFKRRNN